MRAKRVQLQVREANKIEGENEGEQYDYSSLCIIALSSLNKEVFINLEEQARLWMKDQPRPSLLDHLFLKCIG